MIQPVDSSGMLDQPSLPYLSFALSYVSYHTRFYEVEYSEASIFMGLTYTDRADVMTNH